MANSQENITKATQTAVFYEELWAKLKKKLTFSEVFRIHFIVDNIREFMTRPGLKILDLGCGRGWMSPFLSSFGSVTGLDFSPSGIQFAKDTYGQYANFILADPNSLQLGLPADIKFDLVICSEVIEHVPDQASLVKQINGLLKPDGFCIMTTPNGKFLPQYKAGVSFLSRIINSSPGFQPIENWISPEELTMLLQKESFHIVRHEGQTIYWMGTPPFMSLGWLEWKVVDVILRKLNRQHQYAQKILSFALYQIIISQKIKN